MLEIIRTLYRILYMVLLYAQQGEGRSEFLILNYIVRSQPRCPTNAEA